jgi:hypothetical protein
LSAIAMNQQNIDFMFLTVFLTQSFDFLIDSKVGTVLPGVTPIDLNDHITSSERNDDSLEKNEPNKKPVSMSIPVFTITTDEDGNIYQDN